MSNAVDGAAGAPAADLRARFRGALLGLAVGEALGAPAEFLSRDEIVERFGLLTDMVGGGCHDVAPGETTDATAMMLCLAESLADTGDLAPEDAMRRYLAWFDDRPRDVSLTVRTVMLSLRAGTPWDLASRRAYEILGSPTAGNGSLMRCVPLALRYRADADLRRECSRRESTLTHFDTLAGWACAAFNDLVVAAMTGDLCELALAIAASLDDEDRRVGDSMREALEAEPEEIHSSAFVLDSLKLALWSVVRTSSFEDALIVTVNLGGDADTNGAITGALAGAAYGEGAIPDRWTAPLRLAERVRDVADRLADIAGA